MTDLIHLTGAHYAILAPLLELYAPDQGVLVFGSRATGKVKPYSDLDLCLMDEEPLSPEAIAGLHLAFEESDLPFRVDVVEWATLSDSFKAVVKRDGILLRAENLIH